LPIHVIGLGEWREQDSRFDPRLAHDSAARE
jgi:hypothetical protein